MKELSEIQGKNVIDEEVNFFGFVIHFRARIVKDEEWPTPRYLLDEDNMGFELKATPKDESNPGPDRIEELARVVAATARRSLKKFNG